jgi:hypothetical protein
MTSTHDITSKFSSLGVSLTEDEAVQLAKGEPVALDNLSLAELGALLLHAGELAETPGITVGELKKVSLQSLGDEGQPTGICIIGWGEDKPDSTYCRSYLSWPNIVSVTCRSPS